MGMADEGMPLEELWAALSEGLEVEDFTFQITDTPYTYYGEGRMSFDGIGLVTKVFITKNEDFVIAAMAFVAEFFQETHGQILDTMIASFVTTSPLARPVGDDLPTVMDDIAKIVSSLRGLEPQREVERTFITRAELESLLSSQLKEARDEMSNVQQLLAMLELVPSDIDLYQSSIDLHTEQVLGFYDSETETFHIVGEGERFGPQEESVFVHEYVHALQQQHFDISALKERVEDDSEASAALDALIEGDAYLLTMAYMALYFTKEEQLEAVKANEDSPVFNQMPYFLQRHFLFEGVEGISFVNTLLGSDMSLTVDAIFENPPVSTEQILHPEKYLDGETPESVSLPDITTSLGIGWSEIDSNVMGEFSLRTYLETGIPHDVAAEAAAGWGGDRYAFLQGPQNQQVLVLLAVWDTQQDAREFADVVLAPLEGSPYDRYVGINGDTTLLIIAPSDALVASLLGEFAGY
jgi:hypothetical protein